MENWTLTQRVTNNLYKDLQRRGLLQNIGKQMLDFLNQGEDTQYQDYLYADEYPKDIITYIAKGIAKAHPGQSQPVDYMYILNIMARVLQTTPTRPTDYIKPSQDNCLMQLTATAKFKYTQRAIMACHEHDRRAYNHVLHSLAIAPTDHFTENQLDEMIKPSSLLQSIADYNHHLDIESYL